MSVLPEHRRQDILQESSKLCMGIWAQVKWRFAEYDEFPYRWASCVHPCVSAEAKEGIYDEFFDVMRDCCRGEAFDAKVYRLFRDKITMKVADQFWAGFQAFCWAFRFANMSMERLFAAFRQWVRSDRADIERMLSTGILGQLLHTY